MRNARVRWLLPTLLAPLLMASFCSGTTESPLDPSADEFSKQVVLENIDTGGECIHIFAPGEDFPCCRVCPGVIGRTALMTLKRQQTYTFRAGREEVELDTQTCRAVGAETDRFVVQWIGAGLRCVQGFSDA